MGELDLRMLRQLRDKPDPDPIAERQMEMYRGWCRENGITPTSFPLSGHKSRRIYS